MSCVLEVQWYIRKSSCPHEVSILSGKADIIQVVTGIMAIMKEKVNEVMGV